MKKDLTIIALIPARAGSKRIPDKNIRPLAGHPLIAYSLAAAQQSGVFSAIVVSTDNETYANIARKYGGEVPFLRPAGFSGDLSADIEWVEDCLRKLKAMGREYDCFSILRPTSPFRTAATILRAWDEFRTAEGVDSLRAVEKCSQHPGKMWIAQEKRMTPLLPFNSSGQPWHSLPYQALPEVYIQNASLEIANTQVVFEQHTISGRVVMPFFTEGYEGFDLNQPYDWDLAELAVKEGKAILPAIP